MVAAPTLEAFVKRLLQMLFAVSVLSSAAAMATTHVLVIGGLGGEPQFDERFAMWSEKVAQASATATGDVSRVYRLSGAAAKREAIEQRLTQLAGLLKAGDELVVVLLGHGSSDSNEYRLNIPGPDITGSQFAVLLDRIPTTVSQLIVNTTSTSGAVAERWAKPNRVVMTATKTGGERNATRFGGHWAAALSSDEADLDKDGAVTALEAYRYAERKVADDYKADAAVMTEHAKLVGADPSRFVVARLGAAALFANDEQLRALRSEQAAIEGRLGELRPLKAQLAKDDYLNRIEPVLLELARLGVRADARLATLGVKTQEVGNAVR
jgi:hypothetical protein